MFRFLKYLIVNALVVGSFAGLQSQGWDWGSMRNWSSGSRSGSSAAHK